MDREVSLYINSLSTPWLDQLMLWVTRMGNAEAIIIATVSLIGGLYYYKKRRLAVFVSVAMVGVIFINSLLKLVFARQRPDLWETLITEQTYSFPSGHAAFSCALALCAIVIAWRTRWRWLVLSVGVLYFVAVSFSRVYLGVHYLTDIIAGWLVAALWVLIAMKITDRIVARARARKKK